jgi:glycerophosphoryl diester phosphodiesterase
MPERHPYLDGPYPRAYAHRGWHTGELAGCENTLAAFVRAVDEGFGYLELDVRASADRVAMVHHDVTLDRTTDATGPLAAALGLGSPAACTTRAGRRSSGCSRTRRGGPDGRW